MTGGTFVYGESHHPLSFDPVTSSDPVTHRLSELLFSSLMRVDEHGEAVPELATGYDVSENGLIYTFHLRRDVTWHDGTRLTADDVRFTCDLIRHPVTQTAMRVVLDFIAGVRVVDSFTVRFTLRRRVFNPLGRFCFKILPRHKVDAGYLTVDSPFSRQPVGSGPYQLATVRSDGSLELVANEQWFHDRPRIDRIIVRFFENRERLAEALLDRSIHCIPVIQARDAARFDRVGGIGLHGYNALTFSCFALNQRNEHLARPLVRQALTMAIDRERMLLVLLQGQGTVISGPFPPGSYSCNPSIPPIPYSPRGARRLLARAGYEDTDGDGVLEYDGVPLRLAMIAVGEDPLVRRICTTGKDYLREVGVAVDLRYASRAGWEAAVLRAHDFDVTPASWLFDDAVDITSLFHSLSRGSCENNFIGYANPLVDQLCDEFESAGDPSRRLSVSHQLHAVLNEDCPYIFLWSLPHCAAISTEVGGISIDPYGFFSCIERWYMAPRGETDGDEIQR